MSNLAYFEVPVDNIERAKNFYSSLLNWKIEPTKTPGMTMEYYDITTGEAKEGTLNMGGMYRRQDPNANLLTYAMVDDIDEAIKKVTRLGGKILIPKMTIPNVGNIVTITDSEGNPLGLWQPGMM
ncbi:MAG: VOC family protein [Methanomicrobiales archaeon]|nr:VOC family protein [Methanomicrobiales archaeon]